MVSFLAIGFFILVVLGIVAFILVDSMLTRGKIWLNQKDFVIKKFRWKDKLFYQKRAYLTKDADIYFRNTLFGKRAFVEWSYDNPKPLKYKIKKQEIEGKFAPINLKKIHDQDTVRALLSPETKQKVIMLIVMGAGIGAVLTYFALKLL